MSDFTTVGLYCHGLPRANVTSKSLSLHQRSEKAMRALLCEVEADSRKVDNRDVVATTACSQHPAACRNEPLQ
jgi:hypothetical protein